MLSLPAESGGGGPRRHRPAGRGKRRRLSRSAEFERVYRQGRSAASRYFVVYAFARAGGEQGRLGVSVSRKVGGAVERNRMKRLMREAFWGLVGRDAPARDFVIVARPAAAELAAAGGERRIEEALRPLLDEVQFEGDKAA